MYYLWRSLRKSFGRSLQFLDLLIKVSIKITFDNACVRLFDLVAVEIDKEYLYIIQKFVNPREMKKRLINGLHPRLV